MNQIAFQTEHRLSDMLALQFFMLRHHLMRRALFLGTLLLVGLTLTTLMNGAPLSDSLADLTRNAGMYVTLFLVGLAVIHIVAFGLATAAWARLSRPRQISAVITPDGITLQKDGFSYNARWSNADLVTESGAAYLLKFHQLYMRLPKRGFAPGQDEAFRALAAFAPPAVNRL